MIDYDSFSRCHLTDIFFRFSSGSKRLKVSVGRDQKKMEDLAIFSDKEVRNVVAEERIFLCRRMSIESVNRGEEQINPNELSGK